MKTRLPYGAIMLLLATQLNYSCKKEKSCEGCINGNKPPIAIAGPDQLITLPTDSVLLNGIASSDPDGTISSFQWKRVSGPSFFNISNASASATTIKNLVTGVYQFELKVTDNKNLSAKDTVQVTVTDPTQPNQPPVARAGADQTIVLPVNTVALDGSVSTDPDNNIISYLWTKIAGPLSFNVTNTNAVQTQVTALVQGVYQFELKVADAGGLFSKDTLEVIVQSSPPPPSIVCGDSLRPHINAQLVPVGTMSLPRAGTNAVYAGNKIFFAGSFISYDGGTSTDYATKSVDIFDIPTNTWATAELSEARFGIAIVAAGNKVFFAGGENGDGAYNLVYNNVDIYDISTNTWSVAFLSQRRSYIAAAVVGNKVFFAGGETTDVLTSDRVDIYDLSTSTWSTASLSEARAGISATTVNDKIYFAGGHVTNYFTYIPSNRVDIYDNTTQSWTIASMNVITGDVSGIGIGDKIYWARDCKLEIKNVNTGSSVGDSLFRPGGWIINDGQNVVKKDNKLLFFRLAGSNRHKFDIYDLTTHIWSIGILPQSLPQHSSVIAVNNTVYFFGGVIPGAPYCTAGVSKLVL